MIVSVDEASVFVDSTNAAALAADTKFQAAVAAADQFVKTYCRRGFEYAAYTVLLVGGDQYDIILPEIISSVTSVSIDRWGEFGADTLADITRFTFNGRRLTYLDGYFPLARHGAALPTVKAIFNGGYWPANDVDPLHVPKMPADLRRAVKLIIATDWRGGTSERYTSESLGEYSYTREAAADSFPYDDNVRAVLDEYASWGSADA